MKSGKRFYSRMRSCYLMMSIKSVISTFTASSSAVPICITRFALSLLCLGSVASLQATYESWAAGEFTSVVDAEAAPGADPDSDGIVNLREYAFDLDPNEPDASPEESGILEFEGSHYLFIRFPRRTDASDLRYEVRAQDGVYDLCDGTKPYDWVMGSSASQPGLVSTDNSTNPPTVTIRDYEAPLEGSTFRGFLQLFVVLDAIEQTVDFVTVGDLGNPADSDGYGDVAYEFEIGECEITNDQYAEFLNAVASEDNWRPKGVLEPLYDVSIGNEARGGIYRHGEAGSYTYSVKPLMGDKPVIYISFYSACKYCNWLHNGKLRPRCRRMMVSTTEDGAYDFSDDTVTISNGLVRRPGARYFVPTEDEWCKAAYYDPTKSSGSKYWRWATRSDIEPTAAAVDGSGVIIIDTPASKLANYAYSASWDSDLDGSVEAGNLSAVASAGAGSKSFYGVADMDGNVTEWTETAKILSHHTANSNWARIERGSAWNTEGGRSKYRVPNKFSEEIEGRGFRVARILP